MCVARIVDTFRLTERRSEIFFAFPFGMRLFDVWESPQLAMRAQENFRCLCTVCRTECLLPFGRCTAALVCAGEKSVNMRVWWCVCALFPETPSTLHSDAASLSHSRAVCRSLDRPLGVCVPVPADTQAFGKNGTKAQQFSLHFLRNDVCFHMNTDE